MLSLDNLRSKDAILPAVAGGIMGAAAVYLMVARPATAKAAKLEHDLEVAKHFEIELHECGLKTEVLRGRQLEAALPAERKPEDHATRPNVAPGELAVFVAPICPFAHRAWLTALEKCGPKGFRAIHVPLGRDCKPKWYSEVYEKGTVPSLQMGPDFTLGDSIPVCKWIDEHMDGPTLSPQDAASKEAVERVIALFGSKIVGPCYSMLKNKDPALDYEKGKKVLAGCEWFDDVLAFRGAGIEGSPFFCGEKFGLFECLTCSFFERFRNTLKHWRGCDILDSKYGRRDHLNYWLDAIEKRPSFQLSRRAGEYYIHCYASYADNNQRVWDALAPKEE